MTNETQTASRIEIAAVILLAMAAIATALASFQSSLHGGQSVEAYSQSNKLATEAAAERSAAIVAMARDNAVDAEAARLILEADAATGETAERLRGWATYLYTSQMSEAGYQALGLPAEARSVDGDDQADEGQQAALQESLLEAAMEKDLAADEGYRTRMLAKSQELFTQADVEFKKAQGANSMGDLFQLMAVIYAISLFFGGIVQVFRQERLQMALIASGGVAFVAASGYMLTLQWLAP